MKREKQNSLIVKWKDAFPNEKAKTIEAEKLPTQVEPQSNEPVLTLIKKMPVTFQISRLVNPKDFELMGFVIKACLKIADRSFKTVLHVERSKTGSRLVACDGKRLHVAEISKKIKSGNYRPHVTKDTITLGEPVEEIRFPAWSKEIPDNAIKRGVINLEESGLGRNRRQTEKLSVALHTFMKQTGEPVNLRYLEDLTKREWSIYSQEGRKAIILRQKPAKIGEAIDKSPVAIIMPIAEVA